MRVDIEGDGVGQGGLARTGYAMERVNPQEGNATISIPLDRGQQRHTPEGNDTHHLGLEEFFGVV